jgi:hypothetical protein
MPPDLNSLPPSPAPSSPLLQHTSSRTLATEQPRSMSQSSSSPTVPASHTPPHSLAAAATMNAGIHTEDLRRQSSGSMRREVERARRRSSIRMNLNLNDPGLPAPGEMQTGRSGQWPHSPHHERTPSLGELHQELEYEQEGQVVNTQPGRLLRFLSRLIQPPEPPVEHDPPTADSNPAPANRPPTTFHLRRRRRQHHTNIRALHVPPPLCLHAPTYRCFAPQPPSRTLTLSFSVRSA